MENASITSVTNGQEKSYKRLIEDAAQKGIALVLEKKYLDKDGMQVLLERGDELSVAVVEAIVNTSKKLGVSNQFAGEKVNSNYKYPAEYAMKHINEQIQAIADIFNLNPNPAFTYVKNVLPTLQLPEGAEGWFAVPRWQAVAGTYNEAVEIAVSKMDASRKFYNYRSGQLGPNYLRLHARTSAMLDRIAETQPGDILIIPLQLGELHKGESVRRAREIFYAGEFGLGSFQVLSVALVHPKRLVRFDDLDMDCAGDEYAPDGVSVFSMSLSVYFDGGEVGFGYGNLGGPGGDYGSVSGFLPACRQAGRSS